MVARLRDHIERVDDGVVYAIDDLAVVLRALVCTGSGNDVLLRLASSMKLATPEMEFSKTPEVTPDMRFGVGSIPVCGLCLQTDGAVRAPLSKWRDRTVVVLRAGKEQRKFTWNRFISTYAHKWGGAHLDEIVPADLQLIDQSDAGGLFLSNYLLRSAGVAVWHIAQAMFREAMPLISGSPDLGASSSSAVYGAPGSISDPPRDRSELGLLQYFFHVGNSGDLLWYVDEKSSRNSLRLMFGSLPYDVTYDAPDVRADRPVPDAQGPRGRVRPKTMVLRSSATSTTTQVSGRVRTIAKVREEIASDDS